MVKVGRTIIMSPKFLDETPGIYSLNLFYSTLANKKIHVDKELLFWEHHFEAFEKGYPNGHRKMGSIRYMKDHIRVPFGMKLPVYETKEAKQGLPPRGIVTIEYVAACPLQEITEEELLWDGFENKEDLLWQMTEMEGRYYKDLTPESVISYYKFKEYNPNPSQKEIKSLLEILSREIRL